MLKLFVVLLCILMIGYGQKCYQRSLLKYLKISTYDFSVRLLDRVAQETEGHFVFSPISTWLQLMALADGADGETLKEILNVTNQNMICSRKIVRRIFNSLETNLSKTINRRSIFVIDELLDVKQSFVRSVETLKSVTVLQSSFNRIRAKRISVKDDINKINTDLLHDDDFEMKVILMADEANMKVNWKNPFNPAYTEPETFYSYEKVPVGNVNMMYQTGYFNFNNIPELDAQAVELPFNDRASMILLLPNKGTAENLFFKMENIRMSSILRSLRSKGTKLINLKIPKFNLTTEIDNVPELLHDMGIEKAFSPLLAEFQNISKYRVYVSLMANKYNIEVTETGVSASVVPEAVVLYKESIDISFNRPFTLVILDRTTDTILFSGMFSKPNAV